MIVNKEEFIEQQTEDYDNYNEDKESALKDFKNQYKTDLTEEFINKNEDEFNKFCEEEYYDYLDIINTKFN